VDSMSGALKEDKIDEILALCKILLDSMAFTK
jgi:hypothetical protein